MGHGEYEIDSAPLAVALKDWKLSEQLESADDLPMLPRGVGWWTVNNESAMFFFCFVLVVMR